jgi:serine kinase of HPr protein (carbohydrate metabolism regulator)
VTDQPLHGVAVARRSRCGWRGVWITGPSGAGKSDLALRLISRGWRLVADDYAHVFASGGSAWATPAPRIGGLIEARGVGVLPACALGLVRLDLVVALTAEEIERLPDPAFTTLAGVAIPRLHLRGFEASAPEKVALALAAL